MFDTNKKIVLSVCVLFGAYLVDYFFIHTGESTVLEFHNGRLKGKVSLSRGGREFYEFLGVPYAEPPLGKLRFLSPKPVKPWSGTLDATKYQSKCMQVDTITNVKSGSEDCLYLNVFSPKTTVPALSPVIVYFHGGNFMMGDAKTFGPKYFMDEAVVLVTVSYRLASLGFLNAGNKYARGNQGLKDQVQALKWIKENIAYFSGDPNSVTIFGHSAGAGSAHLHMLSKMSSGLFHRVISSSGTAIAPFGLQKSPIEQAKRLGKRLRCPIRKTEAMVACMGQAEVQRMVESHRETVNLLHDRINSYGPTIETVEDDEAFLTKDPVQMLKDGEIVNNVPWIVGVTADEGLANANTLIRNNSMMKVFEKNWQESLQKILIYTSEESSIHRKIRNFYFGDSEGDFVSRENVNNISQMFGDRMHLVPTHNSAIVHSKKSNVYLYYFNQPVPLSLSEIVFSQNGYLPPVVEIGAYLAYKWVARIFSRTDASKGVSHFDDQTFFFNMPFLPEYPEGDEHYQFSRDVVKLWVSFARDGKPSDYNGVQWQPVDKEPQSALKYLEISKTPRIIEEPFTNAVKFWKSLNLR